MISHVDKLIEKLKRNGYSVTTARQAVFEALIEREPMSMQQLISAVPLIDRASVYRTIELFSKLGIIEKLTIGWKYKLELSDDFQHHHHHLTCKTCHSIQSMGDNAELERLLHKIAESEHFSDTAHQLEISGICKNCRLQQ